MINFFIYKNIKFYPFILIISKISDKKEEIEINLAIKKINNFLIENDLINNKNIIIYNIYNSITEKKIFSIEKGKNVNIDKFNYKMMEYIVLKIINTYNTDYEIIYNNDKFKMNKLNTSLDYLNMYW